MINLPRVSGELGYDQPQVSTELLGYDQPPSCFWRTPRL